MWNSTKIKALRNAYDETQAEFCRRLGVTLSTLKYWEIGRAEPLGPAQLLLSRLEEDLRDGKKRDLQPA